MSSPLRMRRESLIALSLLGLALVSACKGSGASRGAVAANDAAPTDSAAASDAPAGGDAAAGTGGAVDALPATGGSPGSGGSAGGPMMTANGGAAAGGDGETAAGGHGGAAGGGAGATKGAPACPGATPVSTMSCRSGDDCGPIGPVICCQAEPCWPDACPIPPSMCASMGSHFECDTDMDCAPGGTCVSSFEGCPRCEFRRCHNPPPPTPPCTTQPDSCAPDGRCQPDGTCAPLACDAGYACGDPYRCRPGSARADTHGCELIPCDDGWSCGLNARCTAPGQTSDHGCTTLSCTADADCDCGFCVKGQCASALGFCSFAPA